MDSKFKGFIIGLLRRGSMRWKPAQEAINEVKEIYYIESKKGKKLRRVKFRCNICKQFYSRKEIQLDHIEPVVNTKTGWESWDSYINRMFTNKSGYQVLCKGCHLEKSKSEREERKLVKKKLTCVKK